MKTPELNRMNHAKVEQRALKISMFSTIFFVVLGLSFAFLTHSNSILFDGIFSLIAFSIGILTLKVAQYAERPDDDTFHYGYSQFEPLINVFKSLFVLAACAFALFSAVQSLLVGGNSMEFGFAVIYGIIATTGCYVIGFYLRYVAKKINSGLLRVDAMEWLIDGTLSFGILIGFVIAYFLQQTIWYGFTPYIDPVLLIIIITIALPFPLKILFDNTREVISMAPPEPVVDEIEHQLNQATRDIPLDDYDFRVSKKGRNTFLRVYLMVSDDFHFNTVADLDGIREKIDDHMIDYNPEITMDIMFIKDKVWADLK
jgi:cation diffusion facilitator family transporter